MIRRFLRCSSSAQLLAGTGAGTGMRGHVGMWGGGHSAVQPHSMGRIRGGEEGHTHTHTQEHIGTYRRMLHLPFSNLPFQKSPMLGRWKVCLLNLIKKTLSKPFDPHSQIYVTRAGVLYFGHFLRYPREPRQLKPRGEPLQSKAFSTIKGPSVPLTGGVRSPYGAIGSLDGGIRSPYRHLLIAQLSVEGLGFLIVRAAGRL